VVPRQPTAAPFHDWNERITAECYRPNGWARILDDHGRIVAIVDNYRRLSFDMGPTLLSWLEDHAADTYARIIEADRASRRAIAQAYGHAILPLCNDRDLRTQIRWGLADFRHRFGRPAEGLWLPETAVDDRVLAALAEEGVGFTILAPGQITAVRAPGSAEWDTRAGAEPAVAVPGALRWRHPHDPALGVDLVVYDGPLSHEVAFGGFLAQMVVDRVVGRRRGDLVSVACDGESFGHHHTYADRGVAYALTVESDRRGVALPRLADWLAQHPPVHDGMVHVSAWSCAHGVARWMDDCGCHTGGEPGWNQAWRAPLRAALDRVRDWAVEVFERRGPAVLHDPWAARDAYIELVLGATNVSRFAAAHVVGGEDAVVEALTLLESQRHALLMYTSCGWFFNDLAGIETVQIMRYAACCCDLLAELGEHPPREEMLATLAEARSNDPAEGDGREIWRRHVDPSRVDPGRVAAHLALTDLLAGDAAAERIAGFELERELHETVDRGGVAVGAGVVAITHRRTRRRTRWAYAAVHLGALEVFGAVRPAADGSRDAGDVATVVGDTRRGTRVTGLLRMVVDRFGPREFGLESALPGVGEDLLRATSQALADRFVAAYDQLRSDHHDTLAALAVAGTALAPELRGPIELALARRLEGALAAAVTSRDPGAYREVRALAREAREEGVRLASPKAAATLEHAVTRAVDEAATRPERTTVEAATALVTLARELALDVNLDAAQERLHDALHTDTHPTEVLLPLARRLGVSTHPIDLPR
jgi:Domain of unknown function (DUF3536)/Glycosyl hydrolase family 57